MKKLLVMIAMLIWNGSFCESTEIVYDTLLLPVTGSTSTLDSWVLQPFYSVEGTQLQNLEFIVNKPKDSNGYLHVTLTEIGINQPISDSWTIDVSLAGLAEGDNDISIYTMIPIQQLTMYNLALKSTTPMAWYYGNDGYTALVGVNTSNYYAAPEPNTVILISVGIIFYLISRYKY